jgi:tetratricopeptide (TPR) repeat protein
MNCAESQDLLVDLAYGELEPARAAEVQEHMAECAACRAEKAQLDQARKLTASLRELEEPSANFDEPILRAARAEAGMQADGTPGPVVEVAASVKPLGLQAARLDPHARVRGSAARAPWWRRRATVFGSLAAAAAVVIVAVSVSLTNPARHRADVEVEPIAIRAPNAAVSDALKDAVARNDKREAPAAPPGAGSSAGSGVAPAASERKAAPAQSAPKATAKLAQREKQVGSSPAGGILGGTSTRAEDDKTKVAERDHAGAAKKPSVVAQNRAARPEGEDPSLDRSQSDDRNAVALAPSAPARADADRPGSRAAPVSVPEPMTAAPASSSVLAPAAEVRNEAAPPVAKQAPARSADVLEEAASPVAKQAPARSADALEDAATVARRAGDYAGAAALYRQAAALRKDSAPELAAWNLAHAVECLAAGGNVAEAVAVRRELFRSYPDQQAPRAAANSALRSVPLPNDGDVPAGK